jgi:CYTH domain-containing protein
MQSAGKYARTEYERRFVLKNTRKTGAESGAPPKGQTNSFLDWRGASAPFALIEQFPVDADVVRIRRIKDRYIDGTMLRLREQKDDGGEVVFKLTQKVPARTGGSQQGLITNMYLTESEFRLLAQLPARALSKTRYSVPPFGIDVFEGTLEGLLLAEAEFDTADQADALTIPPFILQEVTDDERFTGGRLVRSSREDIQKLLLEYGITLMQAS